MKAKNSSIVLLRHEVAAILGTQSKTVRGWDMEPAGGGYFSELDLPAMASHHLNWYNKWKQQFKRPNPLVEEQELWLKALAGKWPDWSRLHSHAYSKGLGHHLRRVMLKLAAKLPPRHKLATRIVAVVLASETRRLVNMYLLR